MLAKVLNEYLFVDDKFINSSSINVLKILLKNFKADKYNKWITYIVSVTHSYDVYVRVIPNIFSLFFVCAYYKDALT